MIAACSTEQRRKMTHGGPQEFDRRIGTVVCKHWLRSLCKKADKCEFLHRYDPRKMRECDNRTVEECGHPRCPFRHVDVSEDVEKASCVAYDLGFCPDGACVRACVGACIRA
jgi:cleavage and polyadenylation specificity factor subunit 4